MYPIRLNINKTDTFWDPINKIALAKGFHLEAIVPPGANLTYIRRAIASGNIIDVSGKLMGAKGSQIPTDEQQPGVSIQSGQAPQVKYAQGSNFNNQVGFQQMVPEAQDPTAYTQEPGVGITYPAQQEPVQQNPAPVDQAGNKLDQDPEKLPKPTRSKGKK